jgi:hypothetical protein
MDAIALAQYGMMAAAQRFESAAVQVADPEGGLDAPAAGELVQAKIQFKAQLAAFRIADEMQRDLLKLQAANS